MKERIIAYDYIRIVAMLLVVSCHCFGDISAASGEVISILSYLEAPCNGLFFAVSGALLLPVNTPPCDTGSFLKKRLRKIVVPTLVWSIIYLLLSGDFDLLSIGSIPFAAQGASVLWFMYTLAGLYLIAPIVSPWLENADKKALILYLSLWTISLCYPIFQNWFVINKTMTGMLYYISGYIGYFILGYYIKRYGIKFKSALILYISTFIVMVTVKMYAADIRLYDDFWYLSIFCAVSVVFYWKVIELISTCIILTDSAKHCLITVSNLIFGVYFVHYGIVEYVIPHIVNFNTMPYLVGYAIRIAIAFGGALILCYIISYIPFSNYIIGYKHKTIIKL